MLVMAYKQPRRACLRSPNYTYLVHLILHTAAAIWSSLQNGTPLCPTDCTIATSLTR